MSIYLKDSKDIFGKNFKTMTINKPILSFLVAFILSNVLTTFWYMATDEANYVPYRKEEVNYLALVLNHLVYAGIIVYLFPYYYSKAPKNSRGFLFGCVMGALMFLPQAMVIRAIWKVDFNTIFALNTLAHVLIGGAIGFSIALIYGFKRKKAEA